MRSAKLGGLCAHCGKESDEGLFWSNNPKVLDFGVPSMPPMEPDMSVPTLCDDCNTRHNVYSAYADNESFAHQIYCARTPGDALRLLGVDPMPARCLKCRSPIEHRDQIGVKYTCGAWIKQDGTKSYPLTCHAKAKAK